MKTDSTYFEKKVQLRIHSLSEIKKKNIRILDAFAGDGLIWDKIKNESEKNISVLRIDKKRNSRGIYLMGDNIKFLRSIDLSKYDIIDLDAYGSPYRQLKEIFWKGYKGIIHCTFIQSLMGQLNKKMLQEIGYPKEMIDKIPTLFNRNGMSKMQQYLALNNIKKITGFFIKNKNYFYFKIG